ncbi:hypothetical protein [Massilia sp. Leaf139]|uniref:hypothetical protein n=1 Tax=Massilia sp. Leaf139 TaxID=1736272 RepID=UPI0006FDD429|nr:hypothetical protein [Massilia sp. Leaf139]KQQ96141.1 hypothetical protein ASF77_21795 [Massilia sp. Leaf139]
MAWQSWTLSDWNRALVEAVFFDSGRLNREITRIQTSEKFLAQCTGDPACNPLDAQRAFIASFGSTSDCIRRRFKWPQPSPSRTAKDNIPEVFAALYLTLLAASADEETYTEGNFRNRFVELLKPVNVAAPNFSVLPKLWLHVEDWSRLRAKQLGDCRILRLPHPGIEVLIGHSKRLAFPAYRDEIKLQSLLHSRKLSSGSDFRHIASAIASLPKEFSAAFLEEFKIFQLLVAQARYGEAYNSPLWRAVQAITWDDDQATSQRIGSFCLGVDAADPGWPEFYLLTDERGRSSLGNAAFCKNLPVATDYLYAAHLPDCASWTPAQLLGLTASRPRLAQARLWKHLAAGCAALFPSAQNSLTSGGSYYDGGPACLLVHEKLVPAIRSSSSHLGLKPAEAKAGGAFGAWTVLFFDSISTASMARLAEALPEAARQALPGSWRPPRISCSGGAWYGQSLLLSPASTPLFGLSGAASGSYELIGADTKPVTGQLEEVDGKFRIPPSALAAAPAFDTAYVSLSRDGKAMEGMRVPLAKNIPMAPPMRLADPNAWLADGPCGRLAGLAAEPGFADSPAGQARMPALHPRFSRSELAFEAATESRDLDAVPDPYGWLCEALALRFQRRQTLSYADLSSHLRPACAAADARHWAVRNLLFSAGWIVQLQKRSSPHPVVAAAPRTIALYGTAGSMHTARIAGMFPESECALLRASLGPAESAVRLAPAGDLFGIGAIQVELTSEARIAELARQFELEILSREPGTPPVFLPPRVFEPAGGAADAMRSAADAESWSPAQRKWGPAGGLGTAPVPGTIVRISRQQRRAFWVAAPGGWLETDSEAWAFMIGLAVENKPVGQVDAAGNCWLDVRLGRLPLPLVRWWMHWGGGCAAVAPSGEIVLASGSGAAAWSDLRSWFAAIAAAAPSQQCHDAALERRRLALRLRKAQQPAGY